MTIQSMRMASGFKKILVTGASGQLGRAFARLLPSVPDVVFTDVQGEHACNLAIEADVKQLLDKVQPDLIINPAAYTAVDRAESEPSIAHAVNAVAPGIMARWAQGHDAVMIHYSTDYVFDGSGTRPWREVDPTGPLSVYGKTKLAGEKAVADSGARGAIFRTSWVYSDEGANFIKTMLRLGGEREELRVVADQIGVPTSAHFLARMTWQALLSGRISNRDPSTATTNCPIYHLVPRGELSWHGFAEEIFARAKGSGMPMKVKNVIPIATSEYPTPAQRPLNSRLDCSRFETDFKLTLEPWQAEFQEVMSRIIETRPH